MFPQITRLLEETKIRVKQTFVVVLNTRREAMINLHLIKQCHQFCHLFKFFILNNKEKRLFSNKFFSFIFHSKMIVYTDIKIQIKYFVQN